MFVKFLYIEYKNTLSYGNKPTRIEFKSGLDLISGSNGNGKTTNLDVLCFVLFGEPYRKVKLDELINRTNKKNLLNTVCFEVNNDTYIITRGLKPKILSIQKNGLTLDSFASSSLVQDEIYRIIGISSVKLFKNIVALSVVAAQSKPFIQMELKDKREIMEQLGNIRIFNVMLESLKKEQSKLKVTIETDSKIINLSKENLKSLKAQILDYEKNTKTFDQDKANEIAELDKKIEEKQLEVGCKDLILQFMEVTDGRKYKDKIDSFNKTLKELERKKTEIEVKVSSYDKEYDFLIDNNDCPTCRQVLTEDHKNKELLRINKATEELKEELVTVENDIKKYEDEIEHNQSLLDICVARKREKELIEDERSRLQFQLDSFKADKIKVESKVLDLDIKGLKVSYNAKLKDLKVLETQLEKNKEEFEDNKELVEILGDSGAKTFVFEKLLPVLNQSVNEYIDLFGLKYSLSFNDQLEESIKPLGGNIEISYNSFSEGEKKRFDLSILFSFIKITKLMSNWNSNLLIIDEILDSSIDSEGLEKILKSLKKMVLKEKDLNTLIISHKLSNDYIKNFDRIHEVKVTGGFSEFNSFEKNEYLRRLG